MPKNVLFATFSLWLGGKRTPINGMIEPIQRFFDDRKIRVDLIEGMHPGSSDVLTLYNSKPSFVSYLLKPILTVFNNNKTQIVFKIRDFLAVFEWIIRTRHRYELFIGLESVYTSAGIVLRNLGFVKTVVYYVSDYSPARYGSSLFNRMYLLLDRYCCYHADYVWDVSRAFQPARIKAGLEKEKSAPVIYVPNALFPEQICPAPQQKRLAYSLVFAGTLKFFNGPDMAVRALLLIKKSIKNATLHIYGTNGQDQARVIALIEELKLGRAVQFHGFVANVIELSKKINAYTIGVAPYIEQPGSYRAFGDATKLRLYAGAGLPIVTTKVPPLGQELSEYGAAKQTTDDPAGFARTCIELLRDSPQLSKMRSRALAYARLNTWDKTYTNALGMMGHDLD